MFVFGIIPLSDEIKWKKFTKMVMINVSKQGRCVAMLESYSKFIVSFRITLCVNAILCDVKCLYKKALLWGNLIAFAQVNLFVMGAQLVLVDLRELYRFLVYCCYVYFYNSF